MSTRARVTRHEPIWSNPRNPYVIENIAIKTNHSAAGIAWRWRTELLTLTALAAALWRLAHLITLTGAAVVLGVALAVLLALPWTRRFLVQRFWCVLVRHRIHRLCHEARLHTRAGRLPLVLRVRPTKVGERAYILCRAGICAEDFEQHIDQLRAVCYAREARVTRNRKFSHLVTIDIIRRDTLAPAHTVPSTIVAKKLPPITGSEEAA
jgi:hypothetical protein